MRALILTLCAGCSIEAPVIVDIDSPPPTRDTQGPYRLAVSTTGAVDSVHAEIDTDAFELGRAGSAYVTHLPGRPAGQTDVLITVKGPGGTVHESRRLSIVDDRTLCLVDGDCPQGEHCNRLSRRCQQTETGCADSGDCPADYVCDSASAECVFRPTGCTSDEACAAGTQCEDGRCVESPECSEPADCEPEHLCVAFRCVSAAECLRNSDCPAARPLCEDAICVTPPEPCGGDCPEGTRCVEDACQPVLCDDDSLEDNDTLETATVIGNGARINGTACPGDDDIFRVRLRSGTRGFVTIGTNSRLDVTIWSSGSPETQTIVGATDFELRFVEGIRNYVGVSCLDCDEGARYTIATEFE